jgi:hypothetical protein
VRRALAAAALVGLLACGVGDDLAGDQAVCDALSEALDRLAGADDPAAVSRALEGFRAVADQAREADLQQASQHLLLEADALDRSGIDGVGEVATAMFEVATACNAIGHPIAEGE